MKNGEYHLCPVIDPNKAKGKQVFHRWVDTYGYPHMEPHSSSPEQVARTYGNCWFMAGSWWVRLY